MTKFFDLASGPFLLRNCPLASVLLVITAGVVMSSTQKVLLDRFDILLNYAQLAEVLQRRPDGLRITLSQTEGDWARRVFKGCDACWLPPPAPPL
jgi:hypothetical protein